MTETPVQTTCDGCLQVDDHPKIHIWTNGANWQKDERTSVADPSFHFDCLPEQYVLLLGDDPSHAVTRGAIAKANDGVHGDKLRSFIQSQKSDNDLPDEES